jgi:2-C-methyl-D-erythritol 2,4-cyclodiphosphate synthase
MTMLRARGLKVGNADVTILSEAPKVSPIRDQMRRQIASLLEVSEDRVNVKATTTEKLGFLGRSEGLAAQAAVLLVDA